MQSGGWVEVPDVKGDYKYQLKAETVNNMTREIYGPDYGQSLALFCVGLVVQLKNIAQY